MSVNKYKKHVLVLPEDRADHQIAHGFQLHSSVNARAIQVLPILGGWKKVRDRFVQTHITGMRNYSQRHIVMLVDFDQKQARFDKMKTPVPPDLSHRVFVIGVWSEPELLRSDSGMHFEQIGRELASECRDGTRQLWSHPLLRHNEAELERMITVLKPFLFLDP